MKIKEELNTVEKRSVLVLKWFLRAAILMSLIGIIAAQEKTYLRDARYLLTLAVTLVCQGLWGAVLIDCVSRRTGNKK